MGVSLRCLGAGRGAVVGRCEGLGNRFLRDEEDGGFWRGWGGEEGMCVVWEGKDLREMGLGLCIFWKERMVGMGEAGIAMGFPCSLGGVLVVVSIFFCHGVYVAVVVVSFYTRDY